MFSKLLKSYNKYITKYPLGMQVFHTSFLMGSGDAISQVLVEKKTLKTYSVERTAQFLLIGATIIGPAITIWYRTLARLFGTVGTPAVALKKVMCDQGIFAPTFLGVFMVSMDFLQGKTWKATKEEISEKYFDILVSNYCVWPIFNLVNFYAIPLQYQVLFCNVVSLFWNTYVSWKTRYEFEEFEEERQYLNEVHKS